MMKSGERCHGFIGYSRTSLPVQNPIPSSPHIPYTEPYSYSSLQIPGCQMNLSLMSYQAFFHFLPSRNRLLIIAFNLPGNHPHQIALFLNSEPITVFTFICGGMITSSRVLGLYRTHSSLYSGLNVITLWIWNRSPSANVSVNISPNVFMNS